MDVAHCAETQSRSRCDAIGEISVIFLYVRLASWERRGLLEGVMSSQESLMIHVSALCSTYGTAAAPDQLPEALLLPAVSGAYVNHSTSNNAIWLRSFTGAFAWISVHHIIFF